MALRVAVLGAGKAGRQHAEVYARMPNVKIAVVADPNPQVGRALAEKMGAEWVPDYTGLARGGLDAVSIAVPHHLLAPAALWAADAGLHTLLEKPMALTLADADRIVAEFRQAGKALMVSFVHRFRDELKAAHALIRSGQIGDPILAVDSKAYGVQNTPPWVWRKELGGGVLFYNGIHGLDRLIWLTGRKPVSVSAEAGTYTHPESNVEDNLTGTIRFEGGAIGSVLLHLSPFPMDGHWTTAIYGTRGAIEIKTGESVRCWGQDGELAISVRRDDRFGGQLAEFVAAIEEGRDPSVTGEDGRNALALALGLLRSAETGAPERLI